MGRGDSSLNAANVAGASRTHKRARPYCDPDLRDERFFKTVVGDEGVYLTVGVHPPYISEKGQPG